MWAIINCFNEEPINLREIKGLPSDSVWIDLKDFHIKSCVSCGSCGTKTPGVCILDDDFAELSRMVVPCEGIIYLVPVTFGAYNSRMKNYVDRTMGYGLPLYFYEKGIILHPMRYDIKNLIVVGIHKGISELEKKSFDLHVSRNALNMQMNYQSSLVSEEFLSDFRINIDDVISYKEVLKCF